MNSFNENAQNVQLPYMFGQKLMNNLDFGQMRSNVEYFDWVRLTVVFLFSALFLLPFKSDYTMTAIQLHRLINRLNKDLLMVQWVWSYFILRKIWLNAQEFTALPFHCSGLVFKTLWLSNSVLQTSITFLIF